MSEYGLLINGKDVEECGCKTVKAHWCVADIERALGRPLTAGDTVSVKEKKE